MTASTLTEITVAGMTCGHCTAAVSGELSAIPGVTVVMVDLRPGADSPVTVTSEGPLDPSVIEAAVAEAGYALR
ncbi:heavy-metal-associated domain-containing protein [Monashia sp. NPDC004114]